MLAILRRLSGKRRKYFLAMDLGSSAVRSLLFERAPRGLFCVEKTVLGLPGRGSDADISEPTHNIAARILERASKKTGALPDAALIGLGGEATFSEAVTIRRERSDVSSPVRPQEFEAILDAFRVDNCERVFGHESYLLAVVSPLRMAVDGYPVESLSPQTLGKTVELELFVTYARKKYWESLQGLRALWSGFDIKAISSQAAVAAAVIGRLDAEEALLVGVGAEATEISLLEDGIIRFCAKLAIGGNAVTHAIASRMGIPFGAAENIKRQWGVTVLPQAAVTAANAAVNDALREWVLALAEAVRGMHAVVPEQVYIFGGGARLPMLTGALSGAAANGAFPGRKSMRIDALDAKGVLKPPLQNSDRFLSGPEDVSLAAIALRLTQ